MIKPATKASDIKVQLTSAIDSASYLGEFDFALVKREISKLPDEEERSFMMGLAYGAANRQEEAIQQLEYTILRYGDLMSMHDYCLYLKKVGRYVSSYENALKFARKYDNPDLVEMAIGMANIFYDLDVIRELGEKLKKYYPDQDIQLLDELSDHMSGVEDICEQTGCNKKSLKDLVVIFHKLAETRLVIIDNSGLIADIEGLSYECEVECDSAELLAKMNFEVSVALADNVDLLQQGLTGWFRLKSDKNQEVEYAG